MAHTYTDLDAVKAALAGGLRDAQKDNPDMEEDQFAADLVEAFAYECDAETGYELCRTELGWVPIGLKRMRPDIAALETDEPF